MPVTSGTSLCDGEHSTCCTRCAASAVCRIILRRTGKLKGSTRPARLKLSRQMNPMLQTVDAALEAGIRGPGYRAGRCAFVDGRSPIRSLLQTAAAVRDRFKGNSVSYSRKVFIPLTHLCRDYCGYCTFRADPQAGVPAYMTPDEVLAVAEAGRRAGCKEALFSLGDQPERIFPEAKEFSAKVGLRNARSNTLRQ